MRAAHASQVRPSCNSLFVNMAKRYSCYPLYVQDSFPTPSSGEPSLILCNPQDAPRPLENCSLMPRPLVATQTTSGMGGPANTPVHVKGGSTPGQQDSRGPFIRPCLWEGQHCHQGQSKGSLLCCLGWLGLAQESLHSSSIQGGVHLGTLNLRFTGGLRDFCTKVTSLT